ncbi:MAG: acyltransferase [Rhodobacteraceae bacterium]|nr:acyltransferase [Paracoccaceae bacterium]
MTPSRSRFDSLQAVRATAAMMVVLFHVKTYTLPVVAGVATPLWPGLSMGYAGVEIFFVLSGFIMVHVHGTEFGLPGRAQAFLRRRILRIYPFLWVVLAATAILRLAANGTLPTPWAAVAAFTLWPDFDAPIVEVAWSLSFEMLFYLVFALGLWRLKAGLAVGAVWFAGSALTVLTGHQGAGSAFLFSPYNLLFLFGMAAALGCRRLGARAGLALAGGAVLFLGVGLAEAQGAVHWPFGWRSVLYGLGATGIIAGLAALESAGRLATPRWLAFMGDASYAVYLLHIAVMTVTAKVLAAAGLTQALPAWSLVLLLAGAAAAAGGLAHVAVERPLLAALRRRPVEQAGAVS